MIYSNHDQRFRPSLALLDATFSRIGYALLSNFSGAAKLSTQPQLPENSELF
jgi:hypothetical protein